MPKQRKMGALLLLTGMRFQLWSVEVHDTFRSSSRFPPRPGPALGGWDLTKVVEKCQDPRVVPLLPRPSVRGVPQPYGSMTLVERRRTIYFRAENSNVAETELGKTMALRS